MLHKATLWKGDPERETEKEERKGGGEPHIVGKGILFKWGFRQRGKAEPRRRTGGGEITQRVLGAKGDSKGSNQVITARGQEELKGV